MDLDRAIQQRFGFELPALYVDLRAAGCFDPQHASHIQFTDLVWMTADEILAWVPDQHLIDGLIPFAQTLSGHLWAWHPSIDDAYPAPVVYCPDEDEVGVLYAQDFQATMYRMLLDELANTFLVDRSSDAQAQVQLQKFSEILSPFFKQSWQQRLGGLMDRQLQKTQENFYGLLAEDELETILAEDIVYDRLDQEFCCVKESA